MRTDRSICDLLRAGAYHVVFQPIRMIETGELHAVEALLRFDDGSPTGPRFAEAAATPCGLRLELVSFVAAMRAAADLPPGLPLSVNLSMRAIAVAGPTIARRLNEADRPIVIELPEHEADGDYGALFALRFLAPRMKVAIDDLGDDHADERRVINLRPHWVKLSGILLNEAVASVPTRRRLLTLSAVAREAHAILVAEAVEDPAALSLARSLGAELIQAYVAGRPVPAPNLLTETARTWPMVFPEPRPPRADDESAPTAAAVTSAGSQQAS